MHSANSTSYIVWFEDNIATVDISAEGSTVSYGVVNGKLEFSFTETPSNILLTVTLENGGACSRSLPIDYIQGSASYFEIAVKSQQSTFSFPNIYDNGSILSVSPSASLEIEGVYTQNLSRFTAVFVGSDGVERSLPFTSVSDSVGYFDFSELEAGQEGVVQLFFVGLLAWRFPVIVVE